MRSERKQLEPENNSAKNVGHQSDGVEKSKAEILILVLNLFEN